MTYFLRKIKRTKPIPLKPDKVFHFSIVNPLTQLQIRHWKTKMTCKLCFIRKFKTRIRIATGEVTFLPYYLETVSDAQKEIK
jgi:hypothetical protein